MKNIFLSVLLLSLLSIQAQNDTIFLDKTKNLDTIGLNNFEQKEDVHTERTVSPQGVSTQENTYVSGDYELTIDNVVLTDLPQIKRMDSLWFKELYQPILFDSIHETINNLETTHEIVLDSLEIQQKLKLLNQKTQLDIVYHPALARVIKVFLKQRKESLGKLFGMAEYYFPIFEEKLAKYNIPLEMKYLAIIESALNPRAISRAGAGGLWQFMYSTGKMYGLEINTYVDERFDPMRETEAACHHMQDLYKIFNDWNLVLAAYNSGAGNVTKAIRRSGGFRNYWNIRQYLPRETAGYVPMFQATLFLGEYAKDYGIVSTKPNFHYIATDTLRIKQTITFEQVSKLLKIDEDELEFLNPQYKLNVIPYVDGKNYTLKLPLELVGVFVNNETLINDLVKKDLDKKEKPLPKFYRLNNYITYRVRSGDVLGKIARRYHVSVSKIKRWNHLRSNRLRIGQRLKIYSRYAVAITGSRIKKNKKIDFRSKKYLMHNVKEGDTLWNISRRYNVTVPQLKKWNGMKNDATLKPGMQIKIYKS